MMAKLYLGKEDIIRGKEFAENYFDKYTVEEEWQLYKDWLSLYDENEAQRQTIAELKADGERLAAELSSILPYGNSDTLDQHNALMEQMRAGEMDDVMKRVVDENIGAWKKLGKEE